MLDFKTFYRVSLWRTQSYPLGGLQTKDLGSNLDILGIIIIIIIIEYLTALGFVLFFLLSGTYSNYFTLVIIKIALYMNH